MKTLLGTAQSDITEFEQYATLLNINLEILSSSHLAKFITVYDYMSDRYSTQFVRGRRV
jgi:hypothetical protein